MSRIKLLYKTAFKNNGLAYSPSEVVYVGHVAPRHSWFAENEFALTTGDMDSPVRILDKRDIIKIWVDRSNRRDNVSIVEDKYIVTAGAFKRYSCTCTAYKWRNKCSHIDGVKK